MNKKIMPTGLELPRSATAMASKPVSQSTLGRIDAKYPR